MNKKYKLAKEYVMKAYSPELTEEEFQDEYAGFSNDVNTFIAGFEAAKLEILNSLHNSYCQWNPIHTKAIIEAGEEDSE